MSSSPGIYVHVPFCLSKCHYCDFYSVACSPATLKSYHEALLQRIARLKASDPWRELEFSTIFFGGGTPSLLPPAMSADLLTTLRQSFRLTADNLEISIEVNPATIDGQGLRELRDGGFNRLSIGVQSFLDEELELIGRRHTREDALLAFTEARAAGFDNISLDLMYGLPGQTAANWSRSLEEAMHLAPEHLSIYELTLEPDTVLAQQVERGELALPDEESILEITDSLYRRIDNSPFTRYEISNYAQEGFTCRHNLNYWHNGSYLGLGPAAVSAHQGKRWTTAADLAGFITPDPAGKRETGQVEQLDREAYFRETVIIGLRMIGGVNINTLRHRFGMDPIAYYGPVLERLLSNRLLEIHDEHLRLTAGGLPLANMVMAELV